MENGKQPINPIEYQTSYYFEGLTKREYFAGLAMQGLCACSDLAISRKALAEEAVKQADELLKQLEDGK